MKYTAIEGTFAADPIPRSAQRLEGRADVFGLRVGRYEILYEVHATEAPWKKG